jgi:hypothetical protein
MKDTKDIKDMSLLEISDALDTATRVYQNELRDLAKRLREIHYSNNRFEPAPPTPFVTWVRRQDCLPTSEYADENNRVRGIIDGFIADFTPEMVKENPLITHWAIKYFPIYKR